MADTKVEESRNWESISEVFDTFNEIYDRIFKNVYKALNLDAMPFPQVESSEKVKEKEITQIEEIDGDKIITKQVKYSQVVNLKNQTPFLVLKHPKTGEIHRVISTLFETTSDNKDAFILIPLPKVDLKVETSEIEIPGEMKKNAKGEDFILQPMQALYDIQGSKIESKKEYKKMTIKVNESKIWVDRWTYDNILGLCEWNFNRNEKNDITSIRTFWDDLEAKKCHRMESNFAILQMALRILLDRYVKSVDKMLKDFSEDKPERENEAPPTEKVETKDSFDVIDLIESIQETSKQVAPIEQPEKGERSDVIDFMEVIERDERTNDAIEEDTPEKGN